MKIDKKVSNRSEIWIWVKTWTVMGLFDQNEYT